MHVENLLLYRKSEEWTEFGSPFHTKWVNVLSYFAAVAATSGSIAPAISLTEKALKHLNKMRAERNEDLCLRIGVKQGGCSGMSYTMEFESRANASPDDSVVEYDGFAIGNFLILTDLDWLHSEVQSNVQNFHPRTDWNRLYSEWTSSSNCSLCASAVCDPKSLLFMFGMELDYSDALIGGGFSFQNPNATKTCGCGKSFATSKETETAATACNN